MVGITRAIAGWDDSVFESQLYFGDLATDDSDAPRMRLGVVSPIHPAANGGYDPRRGPPACRSFEYMLAAMTRVDGAGRAFAGSQLQTQLWVNRRAEKLTELVIAEFDGLSGQELRWVSPLAQDRFREYQDAAFLARVGLRDRADDLKAFWPSGGPVWDALAVVEHGDRPGVILAEGKSYPGELFGSGSQATATSSREKIDAALSRTQAWLGVDIDPARWRGRLYQTANRLAHLCWLNEVVGVRAWLVHLLFVNDHRSPTSADEWSSAIRDADAELGLRGPVERAGHVLLDAGDRDELILDG